jgi:hypothetical protein
MKRRGRKPYGLRKLGVAGINAKLHSKSTSPQMVYLAASPFLFFMVL